MKSILKVPLRLSLVTSLLAVLLMPTLTAAQAYNDGVGGFVGNTYFENVYVGAGANFDWIYPNAHGSYSGIGFVMPNWQSGSTASGGGAVGTKALGVSTSESNSQVLKEALYEYLQRSNSNQLHASNTPAGQWDRMGSAVVVHTMLGERFTDAGRDKNRTISSADWTAFRARLVDNPQITMKREQYNARENTGGIMVGPGYNTFDAARYTFLPSMATFEDSWVFRDNNGAVVYAIEIICANPLGNLPGLPTPPAPVVDYELEPTITTPSDGTVVDAGTTVTVQDRVRNNGPSASNSARFTLTRLVYSPGGGPAAGSKVGRLVDNDACTSFPSSNRTDCTMVRNPARQVFQPNQTVNRSPAYNYPVPAGAVAGTVYCFVSSVSTPRETANPVWRHSAMHCFTVRVRVFSLNPSASMNRNDGSLVEPGDSTTVTNTVVNVGSDPSDPTIWRLTRMIFNPGTTLTVSDKGGRDSANDPCGSFISTGRSECITAPGQEQTNVVFGPGATQVFSPTYTYIVPSNMAVGTRICFTASVSRPTQAASPVWRHSSLVCITVGKKPKVQVWGGDVRSGGKISTSTVRSNDTNTTYGSWGEYGALSVAANSGFGSGAGLNNGDSSNNQSSWSKLTFANTGTIPGCSFGCLNFSLTSAGMTSQFASLASSPVLTGSVNLNSLATGTYQAGTVTLSGNAVAAGKTIIIVATGTVTIDGNITYQDIPYSNIRDIPQVIIKAPTINIRNNASQVDAWLLAVNGGGTGVLNTCSDVASVTGSLSSNICNNQLVVNGPVVADSIYLRRTAGSGTQPSERGNPAETFNLRADAYLWGYAYGSSKGRIQTVHVKELAPRL